jgi:ubiquinone/menaquinone biosynthesis C-methylase UbiE
MTCVEPVNNRLGLLLSQEIATKLQCALCASRSLSIDEAGQFIECAGCGERFAFDGRSGTARLTSERVSADKSTVRAFWGDVCRQWYHDNDAHLDHERLARQLAKVEQFLIDREHLAVVEMKLHELTDTQILEIGCGGGAHASLFKLHGANVTAVDITPERVLSTALKLSLVEAGTGIVYEADAEHLPFADNIFDIVYSNGVLHHSPDTTRCIDEVWRVLKPGGAAVIMLYARHSAYYWLNLVIRAALNGALFRRREAEWLGRLTEGKPKFVTQRNPITRVYSLKELRRLFHRFESLGTRKSSFQISQLPIPRAPHIREALLACLGWTQSEAGIMLYGRPMIADTRIELWLGRFVGFAWNITARKPLRRDTLQSYGGPAGS